MRIEISRLVPRMIVVFPGNFLLTFLVAMAVGVEVTGLVAGMVMMFAWLFLGHLRSPWVSGDRAAKALQSNAPA